MELGPLAVLRKFDGALIGRCGLSDMALEVNTASGKLPRVWYQRSQVPPDTNVIFEQELGYTFDRNYWGQGYASEAAARVFEYASSTMPFQHIVSVIHPNNTPSIKIAKRCGAWQENNVIQMGLEFFRFIWPGASHHIKRPQSHTHTLTTTLIRSESSNHFNRIGIHRSTPGTKVRHTFVRVPAVAPSRDASGSGQYSAGTVVPVYLVADRNLTPADLAFVTPACEGTVLRSVPFQAWEASLFDSDWPTVEPVAMTAFVLLHELGHLRRADCGKNLIANQPAELNDQLNADKAQEFAADGVAVDILEAAVKTGSVDSKVAAGHIEIALWGPRRSISQDAGSLPLPVPRSSARRSFSGTSASLILTLSGAS